MARSYYRTIVFMAVFLVSVLSCALFLSGSLVDIFNHNFSLNCLILFIFIAGVILSFMQILLLKNEYIWIEAFSLNQHFKLKKTDILLPIAIASQNQSIKNANLLTVQGLLSSIDQRLNDKREYNRYIIGLCVFLGLVGTFWGLSKTITSIASVISGIDINATDIKDSFQNLKTGLQNPLKGMGYAFSSSLFGLTASLTLSFLDIQISKSFSKFYNFVEEILTASLVAPKKVETDLVVHGPAYTDALIERLAESITALQVQYESSEENRLQLIRGLQSFFSNFHQLDEMFKDNLSSIAQITHQHYEIQQQMVQMLKTYQNDDISKQALKSMDQTSKNILTELSSGREKIVNDLRQEIRLISKTISSLANG